MSLAKRSRLGPYEIVAPIGAGGMGEVYRARDTRLGRDVAIKVLPAEFAADPERLRRFEQEARAVAALNHPNILALFDVGTHETTPYLVTEVLEGESLRERLGGGVMPVRKAVEAGVQIAQGLAAAHEKGIVHRDLKPENVFVTKDGRVKILDFGIAKLAPPRTAEELAKATTVVEATGAGMVLGTVAYMSPEQVRGQTVDPRSDIFSFGCVLYEMLSGRRAFGRESAADTLSAILHGEPPGLESAGPSLPGPLRQVVRRCIEKCPGDRFSSAHDLAFALEAAVTSDSAVPVQPPVRRWGVTRTWIVPAAVVVAVAAVTSLWLSKTGRSDSLPPSHKRQVTGRFGIESEPAISPSGNEVAYTAQESGKGGIWITDIHGGNALRVVAGATQASDPAWFPDGSTVAFTYTEGIATSIWKVPRFGGTAMLLLQNAAQGAVSPDGTRIAFTRRAEEGFSRIWVAKLTALDQPRRITGASDGLFNHQSPAWSPDSRTICYYDARDLWLVPADGGQAHRLTNDDAEDKQPVWSADGRFVYFASTREGSLALWRISARGGPPIRVTDGTGSEQFPSLSRDGRRLAFVSRVRSGGIALADLRTGKIAHFQEGSFAKLPAIAPDRSALVFVSILGGVAGLRSLPLRDNAPAGDSVVLTDQPGDVASPAFSPDGRWVAYYRAVEGQREVWVVPARGGPPVNFSTHQGQDVQPVWSPDSAQIAFVSDRGGTYQIWVGPFANGRRVGNPRRVTLNTGTACYPSWSPDGSAIAYVLFTEEGKDVWVAPADGSGHARRLTSGAQAGCLRWFGTSGEILVSGYWGQQLQTLRLLSAETGGLRPFALPGSLTLDPNAVDFDLSLDGTLLALFEGKDESVIWVSEVEKGSF